VANWKELRLALERVGVEKKITWKSQNPQPLAPRAAAPPRDMPGLYPPRNYRAYHWRITWCVVCSTCDSQLCVEGHRGTLSLSAFATVSSLRAGGAAETLTVTRRNGIARSGVASWESAGSPAWRPEGAALDKNQPAVEDLFRLEGRAWLWRGNCGLSL